MIRFGLTVFKLLGMAVIVLILGQITVGKERICDHVRDVVQHAHVQRPIHWIASHFKFTEGYHAPANGTTETSRASRSDSGYSRKTSDAADPEHSESDRNSLSGLLKHL